MNRQPESLCTHLRRPMKPFIHFSTALGPVESARRKVGRELPEELTERCIGTRRSFWYCDMRRRCRPFRQFALACYTDIGNAAQPSPEVPFAVNQTHLYLRKADRIIS